MSKGYVYILSNPSMPGLLKIGKTTRSVGQRCGELYVTGVPLPFEVVAEVLAPDCGELERYVHKALHQFRVSEFREFFAVDANKAIRALEDGHNEQIELLIEDYKPGFTLIESEMLVDPGDLGFLAYQSGIHVFELVEALRFLKPEHIKPAVNEWRAIREKRGIERDYDAEGTAQ